MMACPDCRVDSGAPHAADCSIAICWVTGEQRLPHWLHPDTVAQLPGLATSMIDRDHDCGEDVWTGELPGTDAARQLGLWCYWDGAAFVSCTENHFGAQPDLAAIQSVCRWDQGARCWVPIDEGTTPRLTRPPLQAADPIARWADPRHSWSGLPPEPRHQPHHRRA